MTKHVEPDRTTKRDRPVEIEVTPEMLKVGVEALREWIPPDGDRYCGYDAKAVRDAFLRMLKHVGL